MVSGYLPMSSTSIVFGRLFAVKSPPSCKYLLAEDVLYFLALAGCFFFVTTIDEALTVYCYALPLLSAPPLVFGPITPAAAFLSPAGNTI